MATLTEWQRIKCDSLRESLDEAGLEGERLSDEQAFEIVDGIEGASEFEAPTPRRCGPPVDIGSLLDDYAQAVAEDVKTPRREHHGGWASSTNPAAHGSRAAVSAARAHILRAWGQR